MSKRAEAFQNVSEAIDLDSNGFKEIAFAKYLQSLQVLSSYLLDQLNADGYPKMMENTKEASKVLSVICHCADRANLVLKCDDTPKNSPKVLKKFSQICNDIDEQSSLSLSDSGSTGITKFKSPVNYNPVFHTKVPSRFPALEHLQKENALLFKKFQNRLENAKDRYTRVNLKLELQRRLAENLMLARAKHTEALKAQQKEKEEFLELARKRLEQNELCLNEADQEKRELYVNVLQYEANLSWPTNLNPSSSDLNPHDIVEIIFHRTIGCSDHPLAQWLIMIQIKLKQKLHLILKEHSQFLTLLPSKISLNEDGNLENNPLSGDATLPTFHADEILNEAAEDIRTIPSDKLSKLQNVLDSLAFEIRSAIDNMQQIFYLTYKKVLPEDSDTISYKLIESTFLQPLWPLLITVFRLANLPSEIQVAQTILSHIKYTPEQFGIPVEINIQQTEIYKALVGQLRKLPLLPSLVDKLFLLVQISVKLCDKRTARESNESGKMLGADDFIPILSYVLIQTGISQLVSECHALELLVDQKYMLGEEGYSLTSFQTALKYLEMKKVVDAEDLESNSENTVEKSYKSSVIPTETQNR